MPTEYRAKGPDLKTLMGLLFLLIALVAYIGTRWSYRPVYRSFEFKASVGDRVVVQTKSKACARAEDADRLAEYQRLHDGVAIAAISQSRCHDVPMGTSGSVVSRSYQNAKVCIAEDGRTTCLWLDDKALAKS